MRVTPTVRRAGLALLLGAAVATCRDAPTGPGQGARASLALAPVLPAQVANLAAFGLAIDSLRVIVVRPASDTVADTTVQFAADQDSLELALSILLESSPETFNVSMELRGGGFVLFSGSTPAEISAGSGNAPVEITNFVYSGPGAGVTTLQVTPLDSVISFGDSLRFRVDAFAGGVPVTQFYVSWSTSAANATINAHGVMVAPAQRGSVFVTATTPTGVTSTVPVTFVPLPTGIAAVPPLPQNVPALSPIGPLRVRVLASDGLGVKGVPVTFAAVSGGGSVTSTVVATDTGGYAQTAALSGPAGTSVYSATVAGLPAVTFNVIVVGQAGTHLAFTFPPTGAIVDQPFAVAVEVRDSAGVIVATATDAITIALGANPGGAVLGGTLTVNAVQGIAVFGDLAIDQPDSGYTLVATATGLTQTISPPFSVFPGLTGRMWTNAAGGNWNNPANWSDSIVPAPGDTVYIALDGDYTVTLDVNVSVGFLSLGGASGTQTLSGLSRTLQVDQALYVGPTGALDLTSSTLPAAAGIISNAGLIRFQATTVAGSVLNVGSLVARGSTTISGSLSSAAGATITVQGDVLCCSATLTVSGGFANAGVLELTTINGPTTVAVDVTAGGLFNVTGGAIAVLPGAGGGSRTINGELFNSGTVQIDQDLQLPGANAVHVNDGTINVSGGNLTLAQSGVAPSFTTSGSIVVAAGRTLTVSGGAFDYASPAPGGLAGRGTVDVQNAVVTLGPDLTNDTLNMKFTSSSVDGTGILTNALGRTLTVQQAAISVPFVNLGTLVARGSSSLNGSVSAPSTSTIRLEADQSCCNSTLTFATGFTNAGLIELTSINGPTTSLLAVTSGTLANVTGATIAVLPGAGGTRILQAQLSNDGTIVVGHDVSFTKGEADHLNSGLIQLTTGNLTVDQSGTTPTFAMPGSIVIGAGRHLTVNGGAFAYTSAAPGGLGGLGAIHFNNAAVGLTQGLTNDTLSVDFVNATVNGPGTLVNAASRTLTIQQTAINAPLVNAGVFVTRGTSSLAGGITTSTGSTMIVQGDQSCCGSVLSVPGGFTNNGLIELTAINGPASAALDVPSGLLVNASEATIAARAGAGGTRNLGAALDNQGSILVETSLSLGAASADHVNSGTIDVSGAGTILLMPQGGTTPTFSSTGSFVVNGGAQVNVSGGAFNYQNAAPGGLAGTGSIAFLGTVLNLTPDLSNDTLTLSFTNSTVNGPGPLRSAPGRILTIEQTAINAPFVNQGTLVARGTSSLNGFVSALATGTIQVVGDVSCCGASLTVANSLNNEGAIELTSVGGAVGAALAIPGGVINNPGATITIAPGTGGGRNLTGPLTNHGTFSVGISATLGGPDAVHVNHGTLSVTAGTLAVAQSGGAASFTNQGVISVATGANFVTTGGTLVNAPTGTLAGTGTIDVLGTSFTNNGTVAPGGSPGQLTFNGSLPLSTSAVLSIEIGGLTPGTQYDQIVVTSGGTLAGTLNVTLINGFTPALNDVFTVVSGAAVTGLMGSLNLPSVAGGIWLPSVGAAGLQLTLVSASALTPVIWTGGGGDGLWGTPANWSTLAVPGTGDSVVINPGAPVTVTVNTTATAAFLNIGTVVGNGAKTLALASTTLTLTAGGVVGSDGVVNLAAGTLTGGGTLQLDGAFNWTGGTLSGAGVVQVGTSGAMTVSGTAAKSLNSRKIQTQGIVSWAGDGNINSGGGAELRVQPGGTFAVNGNGLFLHSLGGSLPRVVVEPAGTLVRSISTAAATFFVPLDNAGVTQVLTGTLDLRGGTSSGQFDVADSAQLDFAGGSFLLNNGTQFTGAGLVRVAGGTLDVTASTVFNPRVHLVSGTLQGVDAATIQDSLVWSGGTLGGTGNTAIVAGADLVIDGNVTFNGRTITNSGTVTWLSGQIHSGNGALLQNQLSGVVDLRADGTWHYNQGGALPRLVNTNGVVQRNTGTGVVDIRAAVDNGGSVVMASGTLALNGGGNSTGGFNVPAGTEIAFGGTHTLATGSIVTGGGVVSFPSGTTNVNGTYDINGTVVNGGAALFNTPGPDTARTNQLTVQSGTLGGTGVFLIRVAGTVSGGTLGGTGELRVPTGATLDLTNNLNLIARTLTNAGQVTWGAGQISSGVGAVFINQSGGVFDVPAPGNTWFHNQGGAQPVVNNQPGGLIRRAGTSGTTTFGVPVNNSGAVDVQLGTLALAAGGTASGAHTVAAGATLQYSSSASSWTTGAGFAGAGRVLIPSGATVSIDAAAPDTVDARWIELAGGTITGPGVLNTADSLVWTSGTLSGAGVVRIPVSGVMAIRGTLGKSFIARTIANAGVVSWTGTGGISSGSGAALVNESGASFQLEADADWFYNQGGAIPHIDNLTGGLIKRATAVSAITVGAALNNDGTLDLQTGSVNFTNGGASKGIFALTAPGTLGFAGGAHALDVGSNVSGNGSVHVSAGSVTTIGDYVVTGTTRLTGGTAAFNGSKPAELTSFDLSGGTLDGAGLVMLHGTGQWASGTMAGTGTFRVMAGATLGLEGTLSKGFTRALLQNSGTVNWKGTGAISSGHGAVFTNDAGATFELQGDNQWLYNQGGAIPTLNNAGSLKRTGATTVAQIGAVVNNSGSVDVTTGTLSFAGGGSGTGFYGVSSGATLNFGGGTHTISGTAARINGAGSVDFSTGTVIMSSSAPSAYDITGTTLVDGASVTFNTSDTTRFSQLVLQRGVLGGSAPMVARGPSSWTSSASLTGPAGSVLRIPLSGSFAIIGTASRTFSGRTILALGPVSWVGGSVNTTGGAVLDVQPNAIFDVSSTGQWAGASTIEIRDLATMKVTTAGSVTIGPTTVLNINGTLDIQAGANIKFNGEFNLGGRGIFVGNGSLDANGASRVTNAGTIRPGGTSTPGTLTIVAPNNGEGWPQGAGTVLDLDVFGPEPGTGYDRLVVSGRLTTGGSLRLIGNGVYRPSGIDLHIVAYGQQLGQTFSVALLGGLTGLKEIFYTLTELLMRF